MAQHVCMERKSAWPSKPYRLPVAAGARQPHPCRRPCLKSCTMSQSSRGACRGKVSLNKMVPSAIPSASFFGCIRKFELNADHTQLRSAVAANLSEIRQYQLEVQSYQLP